MVNLLESGRGGRGSWVGKKSHNKISQQSNDCIIHLSLAEKSEVLNQTNTAHITAVKRKENTFFCVSVCVDGNTI